MDPGEGQKDGSKGEKAQRSLNPFHRTSSGNIQFYEYFFGPRNLDRHSKWPIFLRMHGSILPHMILPLFFVGCWATFVTAIAVTKGTFHVDPLLLTVLGFVIGLGLSFRSSTAYERYSEGRKYWSQLILTTQCLGRIFWIHARERPGEDRKKDLLARMSAVNLLLAFAVSLKHKLRFEPYTEHDDLADLVGHLDTYALAATRAGVGEPEKEPSVWKYIGWFFALAMAESDPRKALNRATQPLGNLPLEILSHLAAYTDELIANGQLPVTIQQTQAYNNISTLNDILTGTDRILNTPLPIAYSIAIAQITWVYIATLPFQLVERLRWLTIPGTILAAYIILGILFIGQEIENPFGEDVNDLPLEAFCTQIAVELNIITSRPKPRSSDWIERDENFVLFPLQKIGWPVWMQSTEADIHEALRAKVWQGVADGAEHQKTEVSVIHADV